MTKVVFRSHIDTLDSVKSVLQKKAYGAHKLSRKKPVKCKKFPLKETPSLPLLPNSIFQKTNQIQEDGEQMEVFANLV